MGWLLENMAWKDIDTLTVILLIFLVDKIIWWTVVDGRVAKDGPRALLYKLIQIALMLPKVQAKASLLQLAGL